MSNINYNQIIAKINKMAATTSHKIDKNTTQNEIRTKQVQEEIFNRNIKALFAQDEILAAKLFGMGAQGDFEVFIGKDPIDINIINKKTMNYIYQDPIKQTHDMLENLEKELKRYPILYFYGLGNGVLYKGMLYNKTHEKIVVIEPNLEIIYIVLHLIDFSEDLKSERLTLFYSGLATYAQFYFLVSQSKFTIYAKLYNLHIHTPFYDDYEDDYSRINKDFTKAISQMVAGHGNSIDDVLLGVSQHIENLPAMLTNYAYVDLIKKRYKKMDTAVIVSTGPSLDKQLKTLKKYAPYVTVISLDASYPILAKHGIKPDYVTSIERVAATSTFFAKKHPNIDSDIYFVVASLTHKNTISNLKTRKLVLTMRPQASEAVFNLKRFGYLGLGHSTANQAYQLAFVLKHKNIVLIGQDLAFGKDGASHAKGHAFSQSDEYLYTVAYGGEGEVRTTYIWEKFKNQFESDIEYANKDEIKTYNCTEGGARINGAIERPFKEVMQELTDGLKPKKLPNISKVSQKDANRYMINTFRLLRQKVNTQKYVKEKIEKAFLEITPRADKVLKDIENGALKDEVMLKKLISISNRIDKAKNIIASKKYKKHIENIVQISIFYQELELAKIALAPSDTIEEKVDKLAQWVDIHKYWLFSIAGGLNADIETTLKAGENLNKELKKRGIFKKANEE